MERTEKAAVHTANEMMPDHGSSIADAVRRIKMAVNVSTQDVKLLRQEAATTHALLSARIDAIADHLELEENEHREQGHEDQKRRESN